MSMPKLSKRISAWFTNRGKGVGFHMMLSTIAKNFINLIYPLHCALCRRRLGPEDASGVCDQCIADIKRIPKPYHKPCGRAPAYSARLYEGKLKELIHLFKYKRQPRLGNILSEIMIDFLKENPDIPDGINIITYVPLHTGRLRRRDYNQSMILSRNISKELKIPLSDILAKVKATRPQNELSRNERLTNLKGAFKIRGGFKAKGLKFLLIDDVMTTGATLNECVKVLLVAGANEVRCFTLSRGT